METDRFRSLVDAPGPFVSLYLDEAHEAADAQQQAVARSGSVRRRLEDAGVDDRLIGVVEDAVLRVGTGVGRQGRAVLAGGGEILVDEPVDCPPPVTQLRVSEYPYILPLIGTTSRRPHYVLAAVDHLGADLTIHRDGQVHTETVHGPEHDVHKPVTAGRNGYDDLQHKCDEAVRRNVREIADRIIDAVDGCIAEVLFLSGEVRSRTDVFSVLPQRIAERTVPLPASAQGGRVDEHAVAGLIDGEFTRRRREADEDVLARFRAEATRGSGLTVQGIPATCAALRAGAVDTLIVGDLADTTVVSGRDRATVAPDAESLSALGEAPVRVARADEALPFAAVSTGASLLRSEDDSVLTDGVAALLRYAPAHAHEDLGRVTATTSGTP